MTLSTTRNPTTIINSNINSNSISASAGGNAAGARTAIGQVQAGNSIVLANGVDVAGVGAAANTLTVNAVSTQTVNGGLALFSGQRNTGSERASKARITARAPECRGSRRSAC